MEVKVFVDGVPRVVCGVTRETTCQEVVLALAQAQGQPGRYILREKFKDFERCMTPDERPLETLEKYGEQAKEVQLTLQSSGSTMRRGSGSVILQRQSLPLLSCNRQEAEQKQSDPKRPKRKSLTGQSSRSDVDHQTPRCVGNPSKEKDGKKDARKIKNFLRETIIYQLLHLQDLQAQTRQTEKEISELEDKQRARKAEQEAEDQRAAEEQRQIQFWENQLRAEDVCEKDLQRHFLDLKAKAAEIRAKLEEYRRRIQGLDFCVGLNGGGAREEVASEAAASPPPDAHQLPSGPDADLNRKLPPTEDFKPPQAPNQIRERRLTGPTELKEWWTRWSETQNLQAESQRKVIHRSELTIYLGSTKV
uniref:Ras-associating domain-containing protein n=1 Tax=Oryzias latipes TaxID=8090 RepID=A0A3P9IE97_ORYLA